ncbi:Hypothetical protein, putative [Bodo saltans]|uniref:Pre-mRNA-splicing factor 18 n=1 Tax=Bodo saltans TaxID=75058 RepID=A0A0S4J086_BODSA|nr:Hypothetical protein, putative [Bodo saltans]|eukprot:CUG73074.1 Hypothetical protein, putative [Bodo saltans]
MFGALAAKLAAKKLQQQQQQQQQQQSLARRDEAPAATASYQSTSQIQQETASKRQREEDDATSAAAQKKKNESVPVVVELSATDVTVNTSPLPSATIVATKQAILFLEAEEFTALHTTAMVEVTDHLPTPPPTESTDVASSSTSNNPTSSSLSPPLPVIPEQVLSALLTSGGLRCGLRPLKVLSNCLVTAEDAFPPSSSSSPLDAELASIVARLATQPSWSSSSSAKIEPTDNRIHKRILIARWLWGSLLRWRLAVLQSCATHQVHLGEAEKLSGEDVRRFGHRIASQRDAMREYARSHAGVARLMCALLVDATSSSSNNKKDSSSSLILPDTMTDGLYDIATFAEGSQFEESEGAYFQTVIGSEKWRLGLYSAGDMHMRHSLEKTQRDRVRHVLNNESAMASLHAVKRIITLLRLKWVVL